MQIRDGADVCFIHRSVTGVGDVKHIIKAPKPGGAGTDDLVGKHAEQFLGQSVFLNAVVVVQPCLSAPADVEGGVDVFLAPLHDLTQLVPVFHIAEVQVFDRGAGDDHAVVGAILHLVKGAVEGAQMILVDVLGDVAGGLQQLHLHLEGGVGELAHELGLGDDLGGHEVEDEQLQRTDVL